MNSVVAVAEWDQCGGTGYTGSTQCDVDLVCYILTDYFHQCINTTNKDCVRFENRLQSKSKNWSDLNKVTPVKNQLNCSAW